MEPNFYIFKNKFISKLKIGITNIQGGFKKINFENQFGRNIKFEVIFENLNFRTEKKLFVKNHAKKELQNKASISKEIKQKAQHFINMNEINFQKRKILTQINIIFV